MAVGTETGFGDGDRDGDEVEDEDKGDLGEEEVGIDIDMGSCAGCS
jgi:hypothetical protein